MVFVTGATGLVGSFVCRHLLNQGFEVLALHRKESDFSLVADIKTKIQWVEGDILDLQVLDKVMAQADMVIHSAAIISFHKQDLKNMLKTNVEGTANLINACLRSNINHFVHVSSIAAIGRTKRTKSIDEENKWEESSYNSGYALSKYMSELEVWRGQEEGLNVTIVNPSIVIGPGDWHKGSTTIFKYVYDQKLFYPKGSMNYIDVRDLASIILSILNESVVGERFIVNAGSLKYKALFEQIALRFKRKPPTTEVSGIWIKIAIIFLRVKALFTGDKPTITNESGKLASLSISYENKKVREAFNFEFKTLEESLDWTCGILLERQATTG